MRLAFQHVHVDELKHDVTATNAAVAAAKRELTVATEEMAADGRELQVRRELATCLSLLLGRVLTCVVIVVSSPCWYCSHLLPSVATAGCCGPCRVGTCCGARR